MAQAETLIARALPSEIVVEETYPYAAQVRTLPHMETPGDVPARGLVEVRVPYDGQHYFDEAALGDVRAAVEARALLQDEEPETTVEAHIGHITISDYGRIRLQGSDLLALKGKLPVRVPVLGAGVHSVDDLRQARLEGRARFTYEPVRPVVVPVHVEVTISDEEALYPTQLALQRAERAGALKALEQLRRTLGEQLARKAEFSTGLCVSFDVQLELAAPFGLADDPAPPELKSVWLDWPGMASYRRVLLLVEDQDGVMQPHPLVFDPASKRLQWGGLRFFAPQEPGENGLYVYQAPRMELHVREPGELRATAALVGQLDVELPLLMSGLKLDYFDAHGVEYAVPIKTKSVLQTALTLDIAGCFERRRFSPYRYIQFPGIVLNQMRLGDIVAILESMQFTIVGEPAEILDEGMGPYPAASRDFLVTATRAEGASFLWLWLRAGGQTLRTERQAEGGDGNGQPLLRSGGDLTIAIRAELDGSSQVPVDALNELHNRLKRRFQFEQVIK
jgi:hypothetical protein